MATKKRISDLESNKRQDGFFSQNGNLFYLYHPHKALMGKSPLQFLKEHQGPTYTEQLE